MENKIWITVQLYLSFICHFHYHYIVESVKQWVIANDLGYLAVLINGMGDAGCFGKLITKYSVVFDEAHIRDYFPHQACFFVLFWLQPQ